MKETERFLESMTDNLGGLFRKGRDNNAVSKTKPFIQSEIFYRLIAKVLAPAFANN